MRTRADVLKFAIAFALMKVRVARFKLGLSESQRYEVAEDAVRRILETGQWRELNDEAKPREPRRLAGPPDELGYPGDKRAGETAAALPHRTKFERR